jgi:hypothetical protein
MPSIFLSKTTTRTEQISDGQGGATAIIETVTEMDPAGYLVSTRLKIKVTS